MPMEYVEHEQHCAVLNTDFQVWKWDEEKARRLLQDKFSWFLPTYDSYKHKIQQVDAARYFILYEYGGLYMDADLECLKPFEDYFNEAKVYIVAEMNQILPFTFNNFLLASPPKHRFWWTVFDLLHTDKTAWHHFRSLHILYSTGPGLIEKAYLVYDHKEHFVILSKDKFNPCNACGTCIPKPQAFVTHHSKATWLPSTMDKFLIAVTCSWKRLLLACAICLALFVALLYWLLL